jgi:hypothetical protein
MNPAKKKKSAQKKRKGSRNADGFMVEEDGMVEILLEVEFDKDPVIRVSPDVAKRIMDGEFDGQEPSDIPGLDIDDVLNTPMKVNGAMEVYPLPLTPPIGEAIDSLEDDLKDDLDEGEI